MRPTIQIVHDLSRLSKDKVNVQSKELRDLLKEAFDLITKKVQMDLNTMECMEKILDFDGTEMNDMQLAQMKTELLNQVRKIEDSQ